MNIFYLDHNIERCAEYHCDKHVVKMIVEYAQQLSTAHRVLDGTLVVIKTNNKTKKHWILRDCVFEEHLYKATHINHPCNIWVRECEQNYQYLYKLLVELINQYEIRYNKIHRTSNLISLLKYSPYKINKEILFTEPPCCMPVDIIVENNTIESYRNFYKLKKCDFAKWKNETPIWWN